MNVVSRGFRGYRTLWGSGRPTLHNIASTSGAIWGKYTFYEIQKYGLKIREIQKLGCTIANVVSRGFRGYSTLWGSGRPTLRNISSTSSAIWGKYTFYETQKYGLKIQKIQKSGAPGKHRVSTPISRARVFCK